MRTTLSTWALQLRATLGAISGELHPKHLSVFVWTHIMAHTCEISPCDDNVNLGLVHQEVRFEAKSMILNLEIFIS